jgi:hypothetical protein
MTTIPQGYAFTESSNIYNAIQQVYITAYGSTINLSTSQPTGIFVQSLSNYSIQMQNDVAYLYSGLYNPNTTTDIWLDSLSALTNTYRQLATSTSVVCQVTGLNGVVIGANSQVLDKSNNIFVNREPIIISGGTGSGTFFCNTPG